MAGFSTELVRNVNLQLGTFDFGPLLVDDDVQSIKLTFDRANWTNVNARLDVSFEQSTGPDSWRFVAGIVAFGGPPAPPPRPNITSLTIPLTPGAGRRIRGTYTVSGQRIRTTITAIATV